MIYHPWIMLQIILLIFKAGDYGVQVIMLVQPMWCNGYLDWDLGTICYFQSNIGKEFEYSN